MWISNQLFSSGFDVTNDKSQHNPQRRWKQGEDKLAVNPYVSYMRGQKPAVGYHLTAVEHEQERTLLPNPRAAISCSLTAMCFQLFID